MARRIRVLMTAMATILICVALIAVGSYALFSDTTRVRNHLRAGDLDIQLWRIDLQGDGLGEEGYLVDAVDAVDKEFTGATDENIFDINDNYVVPQSNYTAEMMISRSASTNVAINYWLDFVVPVVTADTAEAALLDQLIITVEIFDRAQNQYVATAINGWSLSQLNIASVNAGQTHYNLGSIDNPLDSVPTDESVTSANIDSTTLGTDEEAIALFKVTVEFTDNLDADHIVDGDGNLVDNDANPNNAAKNGQVYFDIVVNAVQATEAP